MHIILVGLPGAGKTTVGRLAASELAVPFVDVDAHIEKETGMSVAMIFAELGEAGFRRMETGAVLRLVEETDRSVLAPGGGWAAQPGNLESVAGRSFCVYLRTSAQTAAGRISESLVDGDVRPLVSPGRELSAIAALLMNREPYYVRSDVSVTTDGRSATQVAAEVVELARIRRAI
jgi:shikimate kinase